MLRQHLISAHPPRDGVFRWRGDGVSRIEGLSDAVFGFAITLLVVSLEAPRTFDALVATVAGFPAFAASFALLVLIWLAQYRFFRRYGLEDGRTVGLNVVLLFVVVFFIYPLKFVAQTVVALWLGLLGRVMHAPTLLALGREADGALRQAQWPAAMAIFAAGYALVFGVFALLHRHALACARAGALDLDAAELRETRSTMAEHLVHVGVAALSVAVTAGVAAGAVPVPRVITRPAFAAMLGGFAYFLEAPLQAWRASRFAAGPSLTAVAPETPA